MHRLEDCFRGLATIVALPAVWEGQSPQYVLDTLSEALLRMLEADFVRAHMPADGSRTALDTLRVSGDAGAGLTEIAVREATATWIEDPACPEPRSIRLAAFTTVETHLACVPLGPSRRGMLIVGARRHDFPSETEMLTLRIAVNHAVQAMQPSSYADEERRTLAALIENTADFVGIATLAGRAQFLNPAGRRLVGLNPDQTLPSELPQYLADFERPRFTTEIVPRLQSEGRWDGELCLMRFGDGAHILVSAHVFFIQDAESGRRLAMAAICRDIREQKQAERKLRTLQDELAYATRLQTMGELSASIAHEVTQPLTAIITNGNACVRWLTHLPPMLEEASASAKRIVRDAQHATEVIRRIRALSTGGAPVPHRINLNDAIREVLQILANELARNQAVLSHAFSEHLPPVRCDRVQFQQVMLNLLMNAMDAMRPVTDRPRELFISTSTTPSEEVEVMVADSGIGLSQDECDRMFEPFFSTKPHGMGLGLAISRRIIEAHEGRIHVYPNEGHGVTFTFTLPARRTEAESAPEVEAV